MQVGCAGGRGGEGGKLTSPSMTAGALAAALAYSAPQAHQGLRQVRDGCARQRWAHGCAGMDVMMARDGASFTDTTISKASQKKYLDGGDVRLLYRRD